MKNARHKLIIELISQNEIDTQETLIKHLEAAGVRATQTTISRDIRELKIVKGLTSRGTYKYVAPSAAGEDSGIFSRTFSEAIVRIENAKNIIVIKTLPGMANAVAVAVDGFHIEEIIGSVAGDDTILLVVHDDDIAVSVREKLNSIFGL